MGNARAVFPAITPPGTSGADSRKRHWSSALSDSRTNRLELSLNSFNAASKSSSAGPRNLKHPRQSLSPAWASGEIGRPHLLITCWPFQPKRWRPVDLCCSLLHPAGPGPTATAVSTSTATPRAAAMSQQQKPDVSRDGPVHPWRLLTYRMQKLWFNHILCYNSTVTSLY